MGLSATPNAAAKDLGAMLSASNSAAADKAQGASSGADTFGNLLSDRLQSDRQQLDQTLQEADRRRADAQSAADDAATRRADSARKHTARNSQDVKPAGSNIKAQAATTPAVATDASAKPVNAKDLDAAVQAAADPAAQLAAQIEAARQAAQHAAQPAAAATLVSPLPVSQTATQSNGNADAAIQGAGKSATTDVASLAALNAAATDANGTQGAAQAALQAAKDAQDTKASTANTSTPPATPLPDGAALTQALARTRGMADNTPAAVRQLGSASPAQNANGEHGLTRRTDPSTHSNATQAAATAVADVASHANNGGNAGNNGTQAGAQGAGTQFQGILAHANGDASTSAPTFTVGATDATGTAAGAAVTPAQVHTLPTFGDAAWPHSMASQIAFMQVHRQSSAELQLNPAELGGLHVKLEVDNGAVSASFVCQHQAVAELVQDAMPRLRDAMQQGGMQLAQTSVSTGDFSQQQGASQGSSAQGNGTGSGNGGGGSRFGGGTQGRADASTLAATPQRVSSHDGAIDTFA